MSGQLLTFIPLPGVDYRYDFVKITAELSKLATTDRLKFLQFARFWCQESLFFLLYFVLRVPVNHPFLVDRINEVQACHDMTLDLWAREHWKALSIETKVLTIHGWKDHGNLQPGDQIFGSQGQMVTVVANTGPMYGADCKKITFDDCEIIASSEHEWPMLRKIRRRIPGTEQRDNEYIQEIVRTDELPKTSDGNWKYKLPGTPIINFPYNLHGLPLDPYLLGVWLGDGETKGGRITTADSEIIDSFVAAGFDVHKGSDEYGYGIYDLRVILRNVGVLDNKYIPYKYLEASPVDRLALLQGLMDTDGTCNEKGTADFTNTNYSLAFGVYYLAASLGMKPHINMPLSQNTGEFKPVYRVGFQAYNNLSPFRLKRKLAHCKDGTVHNNGRYIRSIEQVESVPVNCIQVDAVDGIYLAGYSLVPTKNSTIITYGLNIMKILQNPNIRIGIFSHTRSIAQAFLRRIKLTLESNEFLKSLFPDILYDNPTVQSPKWSENDGILVKRTSVLAEMTVEAYGLVDGMPTSRHYDRRNYDDIVTREGVATPDQINKVDEAFRLSDNLRAEGGECGVVGTNYHYNDQYEKIKRDSGWDPINKCYSRPREPGDWIIRIHPAIDTNGNPVLLSRESLDAKRKNQGLYIFSCQQLLDPIASDQQKFKYEWIQYYKKLPNNLSLFLLCDPANEKKKKKTGGDYSVFFLWGLDSRDNRFLVDVIRDRFNLTERWEALKKMIRKWPNIQKIGYEQYGMTADLQHFEKMMEVESFYFSKPVSLGGNKLSKEDRIARMIPQFEMGKVWLPEELPYKDKDGKLIDLIKVFINEEYLFFPASPHDDMLDAASRIEDENFNVWLPYDGPIDMSDDPRPPQGVVTTGWADTKAESRFAGL